MSYQWSYPIGIHSYRSDYKDPYIGEPKAADLIGIYCCDIFHHKTNYELAYTIVEEDGKTVVVILAGTRENFYEELKRYMK